MAPSSREEEDVKVLEVTSANISVGTLVVIRYPQAVPAT